MLLTSTKKSRVQHSQIWHTNFILFVWSISTSKCLHVIRNNLSYFVRYIYIQKIILEQKYTQYVQYDNSGQRPSYQRRLIMDSTWQWRQSESLCCLGSNPIAHSQIVCARKVLLARAILVVSLWVAAGSLVWRGALCPSTFVLRSGRTNDRMWWRKAWPHMGTTAVTRMLILEVTGVT